MDARTDTLSGRFGGVWAFLSNPPQYGHSRSLPPSSGYLRSDQSSVSPLPTGLQFQQLNASRSSLPRNLHTPSIGGHSSTTIPSGPVLIPVHSADASTHSRPAPRRGHYLSSIHSRSISQRGDLLVMDSEGNKRNELPPRSEFGFQSILAAIEEEIEQDVNAISAIMGRSRLVLADQHDSHLPPQGEIRELSSSLQAVQEASASTEQLAADEVLILREDASLVEGSHAGSAAYGLLERLQAIPRTKRMRSEVLPQPGASRTIPPPRNNSSPAALPDLLPPVDVYPETTSRVPLRASLDLLQHGRHDTRDEATLASRITNSVVSETYLSAGADGKVVSDPPVVSESGRHYPLYSYDESELFEGTSSSVRAPMSFRQRMQSLFAFAEPPEMTRRLMSYRNERHKPPFDAEMQLRQILERHPRLSPASAEQDDLEDPNLYE